MTWLLLTLIALLLLLLWNRQQAVTRAEAAGEATVKRLKHERESDLAEQTRSRDLLTDAMQEGVLLLDADLRVLRANTALREMFDLNDSAIGRSAIAALRLHQLDALLRRTLSGERVTDEEIEKNRIGGATRALLINSARITDAAGATTSLLLVFHDITRLRQLEKTRTDFVANVSHELRTPLSIIKGYAETLASGDTPFADTRKYAAIIEKHADRLTLLVEDLLTISGIESGQMEMHIRDVRAHQTAAAVIEELRAKATMRGITLRNDISEPLLVSADPARLQQVLFNLVDNAIKYGREKGQVTVAGESAPNETTLSVSDDGPGIPVESRERVFERFYRLDKARSRDQGGTGLGLSIVKHIALAHGGRAWVDAVPGGGARFCFSFPGKQSQ